MQFTNLGGRGIDCKERLLCFPVDSCGGAWMCWAGQKSCYGTAGKREDEV